MFRICMFFLLTAAIYSQDFSGIKIYINPGHGGHDSDDRFISETGFWESESNLDKGLYLRDILNSMGAVTRISRTANTTADDLPLSVIDADANNFDADFFHAIHSNGFQGTSNYTVIFYKEVNNSPAFARAKDMSDLMKNEIKAALRTTAAYSRGDVSFLGFNLGVLRTLNMPGTLSEGSFHDYIPESWRLRNTFYRKHEAWAITRSLIKYFNLTEINNGIIAGILRDPFENVSYFAISGTSDNKKPVNNSTVTLEPGNKIYYGDDKNNGFFMFDSLQPGSYTLIASAENFLPDTFKVTVSANKSVFSDRFLTASPNYDPPKLFSFSPADGAGSVRLLTDITLNFDIRMDKNSVQSAFSINPSANGTFEWQNNDKEMICTPAVKLLPGTDYTVTVGNSAKSFFGINLDSSYSFQFRTRSKLALTDVYPHDGEKNVSLNPNVRIRFNSPIDANTLAGNILFLDPLNNFVQIFVDQSGYSAGLISFEPIGNLERDTEYRIELFSGIGDDEGLKLGIDTVITFSTEPQTLVGGNVINDFETADGWNVSSNVNFTYGIDNASTAISKSSKRKKGGDYSGQFTYKFIDSSASATIVPSAAIALNGVNSIGLWIYGDYSSNQLNLIFHDTWSNTQVYALDTLNYTGWKFKWINAENLDFSLLSLVAVQIVKTVNGSYEGVVYLDDITTDFTTGIENNVSDIPKEFSLGRNYPNPFNPSTIISFGLPAESRVTLTIYNAIGQEIAKLINNRIYNSGKYEINWNADGFPSGIYFYKIDAGKFTKTYKMALIR